MLRKPELVEVAAHRLGRDPGVAQLGDRERVVPLRELVTVVAEDEAVVHELRRLVPECPVQATVELLVRPVVVAADHVRDPEVDVIDDARQVVGRTSVLADERDPVEALA